MASQRGGLAMEGHGSRALGSDIPCFDDLNCPWLLLTVWIAVFSLIVFWYMSCTLADRFLSWHPTGPIRIGDIVVIHDHSTLRMKNVSSFTFTYYGWESRPIYRSYKPDGMKWMRNRDAFCSTCSATRAFRPQEEIVVQDDCMVQPHHLEHQRYDVCVEGTNAAEIVSAFDIGP